MVSPDTIRTAIGVVGASPRLAANPRRKPDQLTSSTGPVLMANQQLVRLPSLSASTSTKRGANAHLFDPRGVDTNTDAHVLDTNDDVVHAHVLDPNAVHVADAPVFDANAVVANVITMFQPTIVTDLESIYSVSGLVAEVITTGVEVSINTATGGGLQVGNNNDVRITVDQSTEPEPEDVSLLTRKLVPALLMVGIVTMATDISTVLHMPANGVVFGHNKLAYFLILACIFAAGAAEVMTAVWLARSGAPDGRRRRFSFARAAICASIVPFVVVVGIKSTVVMEG